MNIKFSTLETGEHPPILELRLVERSSNAILLLSDGTKLSESPVPDTGASRLAQLTDVGEKPSSSVWDAKPIDDQESVYTTLYTKTESAVSWAMIRGPGLLKDGPQIASRLHDESFAVFNHPRFAKSQTATEWVATAIRLKDELSIPVIFPQRSIAELDEKETDVGSYADTIFDARLVRMDKSFWLFLLIDSPDELAASKARELPSGSRKPGILSAIELDEQLLPINDPIRIFDTLPIYEFDADRGKGDKIIIFATTAQGGIVAIDNLKSNEAIPQDARIGVQLGKPLASPSALTSADATHLAAIEYPNRPNTVVSFAKIPEE